MCKFSKIQKRDLSFVVFYIFFFQNNGPSRNQSIIFRQSRLFGGCFHPSKNAWKQKFACFERRVPSSHGRRRRQTTMPHPHQRRNRWMKRTILKMNQILNLAYSSSQMKRSCWQRLKPFASPQTPLSWRRGRRSERHRSWPWACCLFLLEPLFSQVILKFSKMFLGFASKYFRHCGGCFRVEAYDWRSWLKERGEVRWGPKAPTYFRNFQACFLSQSWGTCRVWVYFEAW